MSHNDGKLSPTLGQGPSDSGLSSESDEQNTDFTLEGSLEHDILIYDSATERYVRSDILRQGEANQILVKQSSDPGDLQWVNLVDQRIFNLAQVDIDVPYSKVSETEITFNNANFTNIFIVDRRIVFQIGVELRTATVTAASYVDPDTEVFLLMDDSKTLPATADLITVIGHTDKWAAHTLVEANGERLNVIASNSDSAGATRWIVGCSNFICHSDDGGETWTYRETFNTGNISALHYHNAREQWWLGTDTGQIWYSSNNGYTWLQATALAGTATPILSIKGGEPGLLDADLNNIYVAIMSDSYPRGLHSTDGGGTWDISLGSSIYPRNLVFNSMNNYIYMLPSGIASNSYLTDIYRVYSSSRNTVMSDNIFPAPSEQRNAVFTESSSVYVIRESSIDQIYHIDSNAPVTGSVCTQRDVGFGTTPITALAYSRTMKVIVAVGELGKMAYSPDDGFTWFPVVNGFAAHNINDVVYNKTDLMFIAIGDNAQFAKSKTGII